MSVAMAKGELDELYELIEDMEIAILTTRRADGRLVSRPMDTQDVDDQFDLWFMTTNETEKLDELEQDPNVNVAYYDADSYEWVSVSGRARPVRDRDAIHRLYDASWKVWLEDKGDERDGGPDDPRIVLIEVEVDSVVYMKRKASKPRAAFEIVKGFVTGERPDLGEVKRVEKPGGGA